MPMSSDSGTAERLTVAPPDVRVPAEGPEHDVLRATRAFGRMSDGLEDSRLRKVRLAASADNHDQDSPTIAGMGPGDDVAPFVST